MAKPLSELFNYPKNVGLGVNVNKNKIVDLTSAGESAKISEKVTELTAIKMDSDKKIIHLNDNDESEIREKKLKHYESGDEAEYAAHIDEINKQINIIGDTLAKYKMFKDDPTAYMSMFGNFLNIGMGKGSANRDLGKINAIGDALGLGLPSVVDGDVVKMPPYMTFEDERIISTALGTIKSLFGGSFGSRLRTNYNLLYLTMTNGDLINGLLNALTGDYFKKEFEKSRFPEIMSDSKTPMDNGYQSDPKAIYMDPKSSQMNLYFDDSYENIVYWVKNLLSSTAALQLYNTIPSKETISDEYQRGKYSLPYDPYISSNLNGKQFKGETFDKVSSKEYKSIADIQNILSESGYLTGYKTFSGFEMGTNHNWMIQLYPYQSPSHNDLTCTPPLPAYVLPDLGYSESTQVESVMPGIESNGLGILSSLGANALNNWKTKLLDGVYNRLIVNGISESSYNEQSLASVLMGALKDLIYKKKNDGIDTKLLNIRWFSFAEHTPVLSYDLNFGSFKTESVRLFNSSMEMFVGMNYQATMNMSILDDSYGSMTKYMATYINSIYDPVTNSVAPYYNMAFEIILTIFRTSQQINHKFKLIGIPIEYAPRFEGSSEANEVRVDITFAIVGMIPYSISNAGESSISSSEVLRGLPVNSNNFDGVADLYGMTKGGQMLASDMKYGDVILNLGKNLTDEYEVPERAGDKCGIPIPESFKEN